MNRKADLKKTNRFESIRITNGIESIRIANWNALAYTASHPGTEVQILSLTEQIAGFCDKPFFHETFYNI